MPRPRSSFGVAGSRLARSGLLVASLVAACCFATVNGNARDRGAQVEDRGAMAARLVANCRNGDEIDCMRAAGWYSDGAFGENHELAADLYVKACDLEYSGGCHQAAIEYERHSTNPRRMELAVKYYGLACKQGVSAACGRLGGAGLGAAGAKAATDTASGYAKACAAGDASACNDLGVSYYKGELVTQDRGKALVLLTRGCRLGDATACQNLKFSQDAVAKDQRDAAYRAAVAAAARPDPSRPAGAELTAADRACLRAGTETYEYTDKGACIRGEYDRHGALDCDQYDVVTKEATRYTLSNLCRTPISFREYCGNTAFASATILPGEKYVRRFTTPCRLAY